MKWYLFLLGFFVSSLSTFSGIDLPNMFSDNMVLQQKSKMKLYGSVSGIQTNKKITIKVSWSKSVYKTKTDVNGNWSVEIETNKGSFQTEDIVISAGKFRKKISNILIGEVWFCSGQSNMEMYFKGFRNQPIEGAKEIIEDASKNNGIRMLTAKRALPDTLATDNNGKWKLSSPRNVIYFSAVAYHFALNLKEELNVPIGIICSGYGGSGIEGWLTKEIVQKYDDIDLSREISDSSKWETPLVMYNGMLYPYINYVVSGFVWYQGEGNVNRYATYSDKLEDLIALWRKEWRLGDLPFYVVEITPYKNYIPYGGALLREAQLKATINTVNCELIGTNDLIYQRELEIAHPSQKAPIGKRIAGFALYDIYKKSKINPRNPVFKSVELVEGQLRVTIDNSEEGIILESEFLGFEIAGEDGVFKKSEAILNEDGKSFVVSNSSIVNPIFIRYCFKNAQIGNVKNSIGLPLIAFRANVK